MRSSLRLRVIRAGALAAFASFGACWTLLQPLGGFEPLDRSLSRQGVDYLALTLFSLLSGAFVLLGRGATAPAEPVADRLAPVTLEVFEFCKDATSRIDVVGLTFPSMATERMLRQLRTLLAGGVAVRIAIVNPFSSNLRHRPPSLYQGHALPNVTGALTLRTLAVFRESLDTASKARMAIRLLDALPSTGFLRVDTRAAWHPYLQTETGVASKYFLVSSEDLFFSVLESHFDALWASGLPPDPSNLLALLNRARDYEASTRLASGLIAQLKLSLKLDAMS